MEHPVFLFSGLTAEEKMQALHCLAPVVKVYDAGEWIVLAGETMARFGWIESGAEPFFVNPIRKIRKME